MTKLRYLGAGVEKFSSYLPIMGKVAGAGITVRALGLLKPKRDGTGRGVRANRGRGGCFPTRKTGRGYK